MMSEKELRAHLVALAHNLGMTPRHRMPKDDEIACITEWARLRRRAAIEVHEESLKQYMPNKTYVPLKM